MSLFFNIMSTGAHPQAVITITVNTHTATSTSVGDTVSAIRFNSDGTLDEGDGVDGGAVTYAQRQAATDWCIPNVKSTHDTYEVQATEVSYVDGTRSGTMGSWVDISTNPVWSITRPNAAGNGTSTWQVDFEIRKNGGTSGGQSQIDLSAVRDV
jgi:hypothetical protein